VSALVLEIGEDDVRKFLADLKANGAKIYDGNSLVVKAVAAGEIDLGLVNHYYALNEKKENPGMPVANIYPEEGAFVNIAGVGILKDAKNRPQAEALVEFLLSQEGQEFFRSETSEYPLVQGIPGPEGQPALADLKTIDLPIDELGKNLERSATLIKEAGLS
jgi:iron(III) transport system substrate-binding protein